MDASNRENLGLAKRELHSTLDDPSIGGIPLLIVGNKIDVKDHMSEKEIIEGNTELTKD